MAFPTTTWIRRNASVSEALMLDDRATVLEVSRHASVQVLSLNRASQLNALNTALLHSLLEALYFAEADPDTNAVLVTGAGRAFCAGADIKEFAAAPDCPDAVIRLRLMEQVFVLLREMRTPTLAAVHGPTLGAGAALALACDMTIAGHDLQFGYPEVLRGILPGSVAPTLRQHVPPKLAFDLLANGRVLDADEAQSFGLVNRVAVRERLLVEAHRVAASWLETGGDLIGQIKELLRPADDIPEGHR